MPAKVALLIDAENIAYRHLPNILKRAHQEGDLVLRAIYGDWQLPTLQNWRELAEGNGFVCRHQNSTAKTKNSSDMLLAIEATRLLSSSVGVFCIVSNDADYVPLCEQIRGAKKSVVGIGTPLAADAFIRACDEFAFVGRDETPIQPPIESYLSTSNGHTTAAAIPPSPMLAAAPAVSANLAVAANAPAIRKLLTKAFAKAAQDAEGWVGLPELGTALREVQPDYQHANYGHDKLSKVLLSVPDFVEFRTNGDKGARVRLKQRH